MPRLSLIINSLKITDCADNDEDMGIGLTVSRIDRKGSRSTLLTERIPDFYVQEEGKVGHPGYCSFFGGRSAMNVDDVASLEFRTYFATHDGDGYCWGGSIKVGGVVLPAPALVVFEQDVRSLPSNPYTFLLTRGNAKSDGPEPPWNRFPLVGSAEGNFELGFTVTLHDRNDKQEA